MTAANVWARERGLMRMSGTRRAARCVTRVMILLSSSAVLGACDAEKPAPRLATSERDPDVTRIETDQEFALTLSSAPRPLSAIVTRKNGTVDTVRIPSARSEDTSVVRVIDDAIVPNGVGHTKLVFVVAGHDITANVQVTHPVADDSIALAPGEVRAWELAPGWYDIAVHRADTTGVSPLELAAPLTCAPDSRDPDAISCRVAQPTRIVLKHSGRGGRARAHVSIVQVK